MASARRKPAAIGPAAAVGTSASARHVTPAATVTAGAIRRPGSSASTAASSGTTARATSTSVICSPPQLGEGFGGQRLGLLVMHPDQHGEDHHGDEQVEQEHHLEDQR